MSLRLVKGAVPTVHLDALTKAQKMAGLDISYQMRPPHERDGMMNISRRETRLLLRTDPSDLVQQSPGPLFTGECEISGEIKHEVESGELVISPNVELAAGWDNSVGSEQITAASESRVDSKLTDILQETTQIHQQVFPLSNNSPKTVPQILDAYTVTSSETPSSSEVTESSAVKDEPGDVEITAPVVSKPSVSNSTTLKQCADGEMNQKNADIERISSNIDYAGDLMRLCVRLGEKLEYRDSVFYMSCLSLVNYFPPQHLVETNGSVKKMASVRKLLKQYMGRKPEHARIYNSFKTKTAPTFWITAKAYILLLIRVYSVIVNMEKKPTLTELRCLHAALDGKAYESSWQKPIRSKATPTSSSCYCRLSMEKLLTHPTFMAQLTRKVHNNAMLGAEFFKTFKHLSNELRPKSWSECRTVETQTEGACVPVLNLERVPLDAFGLSQDSQVTVDMSEEEADMDTAFDFIPNWEEKDEMEISFQPPHTSLSSKSEDNFQAHQLSDLVNSAHMKLEYHHRPPDVSISSSGYIRSCRSKTKRVLEKLRDEYECSDVSDGCEESESKLNSDKEFNPGSDESEYDSEGEHFPSSERQLRKMKCTLCNSEYISACVARLCCYKCKIPTTSGKSFRYLCPQCPYRSSSVISTQSHIRRAHQNKETIYKCEKCDRCFLNRQALTRHEMVHKKERPFLCGTCGRRFSQSNNLAAHMRQHTGDKPFQCEHCGQSFTHNVSLRKHFCKHLGRRIEPLDQKKPNIGETSSKVMEICGNSLYSRC
ncbi:hypothetical protein EB796_000452 [Bugula neritina]|uniref:C2H2-type domain-containing protein n=1 Tax=Bugula neritina TaxID=10212 RepID=A0A7J7KSU7_BUGNE|nr:hypothetical protein EB796_000452 [Bugula neritina]